MNETRRDFLRKTLAGALCVGAATLPTPVSAMTQEIWKKTKKRPQAKRVLLLSLDGICTEGFKQAHTPNLDQLLAEGVLSMQTRVVMPSVTLPNWTSHLTESGPEQHGVVDNDWEINKIKLPAIETDTEGYYPSVFRILKENIPQMRTAFYYNWLNLFYPYNRNYLDEVSYLEEDAYVPNYKKALKFMTDNRELPTLIFLYSVHTDHAGHKYKWMSPQYLQSIEEADAEIGRLLNNMQQAGLYDDTHFLFLTDHGGINYGHGGVTTHEMIVPWGITGPGIAKGICMNEPNNTVNTASVILRLFGAKQPDCWTGEVPHSIFE